MPLSAAWAQVGQPSNQPGVIGTPSNLPDSSGGCAGQTLCNPLKANSLQELLDLVLDAVIYLGGIVLVLAIIWTGFKYVAARGNPGEISNAHKALLWTVIGGLILLGARAIQEVIKATAGAL